MRSMSSYTAPTDEAAPFVASRGHLSHENPVTIDERRRTASGILRCDPSCSDASISQICELTVSEVRRLREIATRPSRGGTCNGFADWFSATSISEGEWLRFVEQLPPGCAYDIIDEARRRSAEWDLFARSLTARAQRRR